MSKTYRAYDPNQQFLLPVAMQEWLPPDHLSYFISDIVDHLDLSAITSVYERESRGGPPYHPRMMVKVLPLWLLHRGCILAPHRPASLRGHSVSGTFGQQHAGLSDHIRLSQGSPV